MNKNRKLTKKEIYAKYGIQFDGKKIFCEPLNIWVSPLMPIGSNTKVGNAATFSIYHGDEILNIENFGELTAAVMAAANITSIKASCPLHCDDCYCDKGRYVFDNVKAGNMLKLILAKLHLEWLEKALKAQIEAENITQIRIHAAGDFFSKEYVDMWIRIANAFNKVVFWTYTKYEYAVNAFDHVDNIFLTPSITPAGFNFGTCAELLYRYDKLTKLGYRVHICCCGTPIEKELNMHCSDCKHGCKSVGIECDYVLFIKHSSKKYKAGKDDPIEYAKICEIIANQNN